MWACEKRRRDVRAGPAVIACLGVVIATTTVPSRADLDWRAEEDGRSATLDVSVGGRTGFTLLGPSATGIGFTNRLADRTVAFNRVYENGSGVALGDVDGDGLCDLYFCRLEGPNALYRNLGDWRFADITASAGVACDGQYSTGTVLADVDGDGDLDLLVNGIGAGTRLFLNDGRATFTELTGSRLVRRFGSTSMALADVDGDGDLDLYVTNYRTDTYRDRPPGLKVEARMVGGKIVVTPEDRFVPIMPRGGAVEVLELGERDFLYINDGTGRFAPVSWTAGSFLDEDGKALSGPPLDWGLSVLLRDLNQDGAPDIYVCNDFFRSYDRVWLNESSRRFRAAPRTAFRNMSLSSMVVEAGDLNRDGFDDLMVADMVSRDPRERHRQRPEMMQGRVSSPVEDPDHRPEVPRNTLFLNRGDGTYAEIAQLSGLAATEWTWSLAFVDVDLDGYEDLLVANGNHHDVQDADVQREISRVREGESPEARLARFPRLHTANLAFRNRGDLTFEETGEAWGFNLEGVSQGMALGDLDNDGDLDVVLNNLNGAAALYRNESSAARVAVRLKGRAPNTRGVGARIEFSGGPVRVQGQEMLCGGRYASGDDTLRAFAVGDPAESNRIEITWRSGRRSVLSKVEANRVYEVREPAEPSPTVRSAQPDPPDSAPWFEDVSSLLGHVHVDQPFDDFSRQPLMSHRWSELGPGVGWVNLDGDGFEDLVVGAGSGGRTVLFRNDRRGGFIKFEGTPEGSDQTGLVAWPLSETNSTILVASANYENPSAGPSRIRVFTAGSKPELTGTEVGIELESSAGPVSLGDLDGDGDLDLFVGGRAAGGRYPEFVSSRLFIQESGRWRTDDVNAQVLNGIGLISGALFADLDLDGDCELVLAGHWGPVRVLRNDRGRLVDVTREMGLDRYRGWWNGVAAGDLDGDGRLDLVASNWGRNSRYQEGLARAVRIYYRDFDDNGALEVLEARHDEPSGKWIPWQDFETVANALPFLRASLGTFRAYGDAGVSKILEPVGGVTPHLEVDTLDSMVFLNRVTRFEALSLPLEAQFAPAFGVAVSDFDGDGREDLFLAQNFFGVAAEVSRYDAGVGLLLRGDGMGGVSPVRPVESGIRMMGEQRGCAVADFDRDGRPDLAVGQNRGRTELYRNLRARPGLRVVLAGEAANPRGVGAVVRLRFGSRWGPARAVHAGSGYGSQDALTLLLAAPVRPDAVEVLWPGGTRTLTPVEPATTQVRVGRGR